jgi:hypothetical protein
MPSRQVRNAQPKQRLAFLELDAPPVESFASVASGESLDELTWKFGLGDRTFGGGLTAYVHLNLVIVHRGG